MAHGFCGSFSFVGVHGRGAYLSAVPTAIKKSPRRFTGRRTRRFFPGPVNRRGIRPSPAVRLTPRVRSARIDARDLRCFSRLQLERVLMRKLGIGLIGAAACLAAVGVFSLGAAFGQDGASVPLAIESAQTPIVIASDGSEKTDFNPSR